MHDPQLLAVIHAKLAAALNYALTYAPVDLLNTGMLLYIITHIIKQTKWNTQIENWLTTLEERLPIKKGKRRVTP